MTNGIPEACCTLDIAGQEQVKISGTCSKQLATPTALR